MGSAEDGRGAPDPPRSLLFPDIGSLLDLVQDARRDPDRRTMLHGADRLLEAAALGHLDILVPEQVDIELKRDLPAVERDGVNGWLPHREEARRLDDVLVDVGPSASEKFPTEAAATRSADDARAARQGRLLDGRRTWRTVVPSHETTRQAVVRLNGRHPPAHADEAELADGPIIETVPAERDARGELGTRRRTGFPSSTTHDDREGARGQRVRAPLDADVESRGLEHAAHVGHADALLLEAARP